ncbi:LicD family protein [Pediococcus claussenii]|uniref:LicD family protein n=1 Tax=Pediococcus claussenii (strain ATCC BAA-344 / DSM 14800 / JCM 18046 / KCTC 3811 / LMG 21948 / P06) TaxID=701521 RepID=G8PC63_PEDCP|nr:LicD family protein [Pediococcus claussenii]AEV94882.1 licD family protein [Pediococcus claussenii ATCC BAA-344]ANZ70077.1 lipopolysaccharide cholinephosphotransferase [Pediococcus claussenii]ANZ71892.1 lipopolysaccharide cholinephosphotransferase [Pediococcus claussenii]KRN21060.1 hypothetical protein IV79_GL000286 [Pediococcus claussenii]
MTQIDELHAVELETLKVIIDICKRHDIQYMMIGGSLLGTIRHNGFIPWDDDVDLGMTRRNYDKFARVAPLEFQHNHYFMQTADTDPNFAFSYMKILDTNTYIEEKYNVNDARKGVFVDIFPFDMVPNQPEVRQSVYSRFQFYDTAILVRLGYNIIKTPFRRDAENKSLDLFMNVAKMKERRENIMRLYDNEPFHHLKNYASQYAYDKEVLSLAELTKLTTHDFESIEVSIPLLYDQILTRMYGSYMELPPVKDQVAKHIDMLKINGKQIE